MIQSKIALLYTAKTITTSSIILAAEALMIHRDHNKRDRTVDHFVKEYAREIPGSFVYISVCSIRKLICQRMSKTVY